MKFTISSAELLKQLRTLQGVITRKSVMPILDNFLFDLQGGCLTVTATDLETTLTVKVQVEGKADGALCVPAKSILKALRVLPAQYLSISANKASVLQVSTEQGRYDIRGYSIGEFPKTKVVENGRQFNIDASTLVKAISKALPLCGNDDLRPVMSGVLFEGYEGGVRFVSTDAHRLIQYDRSDVVGLADRSFIVPKRTLRVIKHCLGSITGPVLVLVNDDSISFTVGSVYVRGRLIDGKYPDYTKVWPSATPVKFTVGRMALIACTNRMQAFSSPLTRQMVFDLSNGMVVSTENLDDDTRASEKLPCVHSGGSLRIGFNTSFMLDILKVMSCDEVTVSMDAPNRAAIITPTEEGEGEKTAMLLMPVMLTDEQRRAA